MRSLALVLLLTTGCAIKTAPKPHLTLTQLRQLEFDQRDCAVIDRRIQQLERNQLNAGVARTSPELLPEPQREYQALTRSHIWALRIGCNNPNRYVL
jgi:hypothetical protein